MGKQFLTVRFFLRLLPRPSRPLLPTRIPRPHPTTMVATSMLKATPVARTTASRPSRR